MGRRLVLRSAAVAGMTLLLWALPAIRASAQLHFSEPVHDAGSVRTGPSLVHRFPFMNAGPDPVEIVELRASCGCMTASSQKRIYAPGEKGEVFLEINTLSQPAGPHDWRVTLGYLRQGGRTDLNLHLMARLVTEVSLQPAAMTIFAEGGIGHEVLLTDLRSKPLAIKEVRTSSPQIKGRVIEEFRDGQGHTVRKVSLELASDFPEGKHDETLNIVTDDPAYPDLKVPVTVVKRTGSRLNVFPAALSIRAVAGQPIPWQRVLLADRQNEPVRVERVEADDPALVCTFAQGPDARATIRIQVDRMKAQGRTIDGKVSVRLLSPAGETVTIPVRCTIE